MIADQQLIDVADTLTPIVVKRRTNDLTAAYRAFLADGQGSSRSIRNASASPSTVSFSSLIRAVARSKPTSNRSEFGRLGGGSIDRWGRNRA